MSEVDARRQDFELRREALRRAAEQVRAFDFGEAVPAGGFRLERPAPEPTRGGPSQPSPDDRGASDPAGISKEGTAASLARRYRSGDLSPVEVAKQALERAEAIQPTVNAFITLFGESALAAASAA